LGRIAPARVLKSMGGKDMMLAGDPKQAKAVADEALHKDGAYKKEGGNRPRDKNGRVKAQAADVPELAELVGRGVALRQEFDDVVILQTRHRLVSAADAGVRDSEKEAFDAAGLKFKDVTQRLSDLSWTREDWAWLAERNRSALLAKPGGEEEVRGFDAAPLLMDTRKQKVGGEGEKQESLDGAEVLNLQELYKLARRTGAPVVRIGAYHKKVRGNEAERADLIDDDDFGLASELQMCIGARVLLTRNIWAEAGLMNGALGYVRGYVWPRGGDPNSADSRKRAPLCVVVEFDDVDLKGETLKDAEGKPLPNLRSFFPELGKEYARYVPIFRVDAESKHDSDVVRQQFPLTLAWALTHWKAQGMTLKRVRVRIGKGVASQVGVAFVAVTRVGHPWGLMFETDLPEHDVFEQAKWKEEFRSRERFELQLRVKFSRTLRKYGFCEEDPWNERDAAIAERILARLEVEASKQRQRENLQCDPHEWPWTDAREAPVDQQLGVAVERLVAEKVFRFDHALAVVERLKSPVHMPAVLDALGCLIPRSLHPRLDGVKPKGKAQAGAAVSGPMLVVGGWKMNVDDERSVVEPGRPLT
jgi:hypothetical protein